MMLSMQKLFWTLLACVGLLTFAYSATWFRYAHRFRDHRFYLALHAAVVQASSGYMSALDTRPLQTKSSTAFVLFACSDTAAQVITIGGVPKMARIARFAFWGGFAAAPLLHVWYNFLGQFFLRYMLIGVWESAILMSVVDQVFFTPSYISLFFLYDGITQGKSHVDAYVKVWLKTRIRYSMYNRVASHFSRVSVARALHLF